MKPSLLILSHVLPFPRRNGQQQRVYYTLRAARERFHTTFVSSVDPARVEAVRAELLTVCDEAVLLPSLYHRGRLSRLWHRAAGALYSLRTGLRFSNYLVGEVELSPARIDPLLAGRQFDAVLFEYWHAVGTVPVFRRRQIPCVLDMHNVLWQSHLQKLREDRESAGWLRERSIERYRRAEEASWREFDGVVAITREEEGYVQPRVAEETQVFYAPMGIDLAEWTFDWQPAEPPRVAYYGGLSSLHNQEAALRSYRQIMPRLWQKFPGAEFWLVGSNPPAELQALAQDPRVKVTGFVERVQDVLRTMTAVVCPWQGTYGFRSRLIEVMALGVPVVATADAVNGMELEHGRGLLLGRDDAELAEHAGRLMSEAPFARQQSKAARAQVEQLYGMANTYGRLVLELETWVHARAARRMPAAASF